MYCKGNPYFRQDNCRVKYLTKQTKLKERRRGFPTMGKKTGRDGTINIRTGPRVVPRALQSSKGDHTGLLGAAKSNII